MTFRQQAEELIGDILPDDIDDGLCDDELFAAIECVESALRKAYESVMNDAAKIVETKLTTTRGTVDGIGKEIAKEIRALKERGE